MEAKAKKGVAPAKTDTTAASQRIESHPPPGKKKPRAVPARKKPSTQ
jgi:hypothetical protein